MAYDRANNWWQTPAKTPTMPGGIWPGVNGFGSAPSSGGNWYGVPGFGTSPDGGVGGHSPGGYGAPSAGLNPYNTGYNPPMYESAGGAPAIGGWPAYQSGPPAASGFGPPSASSSAPPANSATGAPYGSSYGPPASSGYGAPSSGMPAGGGEPAYMPPGYPQPQQPYAQGLLGANFGRGR